MNALAEMALAAAAVVAWRLSSRPGVPGEPVHPVGGRVPPGRRHATPSRWWGQAPPSPVPRGLGRGGARRPARRHAPEPARWATRRSARPLVLRAPAPGRVTLGALGRRLVAAEAGHSVLVVGPTQSRKTSGLAVPALLEWEGPVVAASVKFDLVRHSVDWRRRCGPVWVFDPTGSTDLPAAAWSPLAAARTWESARRTAASLTEVARASGSGLTDGDFWYATAGKLLAPLLLAAAGSGRTMADVVRWVDTQEVGEVLDVLALTGARGALQAAEASWARDERQRSAVYTTAETVIEAYADPGVGDVAPGASGDPIDPERLLDEAGTLYLCAPAHDQRRLRPVFATLVAEVIDTAYRRVARRGGPLDPPLLVVLDEAANVAPVAELDTLASTAAGHGVQLVTVWQDLAQLQARYGGRAGSVVNNHRAKVFLSGIADIATLEHASTLIGEGEHRSWATTLDGYGTVSHTGSPILRRLAPADALRRIPPGHAVVVSGHLPPVRVRLRPWQEDRDLCGRAQVGTLGA